MSEVNGEDNVFVRCVSVSAQRTGQSDQFKRELNANSSKTVKDTDFKVDVRGFQGQSGYDPLIFFQKGGVARVT